ncbi:TlpA family protein disulfide reductase [Lentibacillus salinarum]|uniref:TlpA family protein disulfide reductase n=1 Tax=Lentibacillus salinarum TaxID=446820 RepID=A0ABW3ZQD4_9BACI
MIKRLLGIALLLALIGLTVINFIDVGEDDYTEHDNENTEGAAIVPPGETGVEEGNFAPDFEVDTLSGDTFRLSELRGQKVILNFWASWCGPCKEEMPEMQQFHEEYGDQVQVVAVNLTGNDSSVDAVREYVDEHDYTYPVPLDRDSEIQEQYNVYNVPTSYFIGTDGKVQEPPKLGPMTFDFMVDMLEKLT